MRKELLRLVNFHSKNSRSESLEQLNMILRRGESCLLWGRDYTGHSITDIFRGDAEILSGKLWLNQEEIRKCTQENFRKGRVYYIDVYSEFMETLDLAENMFLLKNNHLKKIFLNQKAIHLRAKEILEQYGLSLDVWGSTKSLGVVERVLVKVICSVDQGAQLLVLNNLSSICGRQDMEALAKTLRQIQKEGVGLLIYDSHPERFVDIAEAIYLVDKGHIVKKIYDREAFSLCEKIMEEKIQDLSHEPPEKEEGKREEEAILLCGSLGEFRMEISIFPGEVLYLSALNGQEQEVLCKILKGEGDRKLVIRRGNVRKVCGSSGELVRDRVGFWGEVDLHKELFPNLSVKDNILMPSVRKISKMGFYKSGERFIFNDHEFLKEFTLVDDSSTLTDKDVLKTIFYRWKLYNPRLLILNNVLSRADVEMKEWISSQLLTMTRRNTSILLLESAADDAMKIADRVVRIGQGGMELSEKGES